ncbi:hypothetical protein OA255_01465 [Pelagibacteraceae bacterium]|nr:hypothetical protein [Pelagibacteraceae bacterium]
MIVANWDYKITASKAVDAYKTATKYFEKYGSIGTALQNHIGRDTGLYTFFAGFNNNEHFGEIDDKISYDEDFQREMEPYFEVTSWEKMNFYTPILHNMEPDPGVKNCFAVWNFSHEDEDLILKESETFFKYWMDAGANGGTVGTLRGSQSNWGFGIRFQSMKDYGKAQDKLDQDGVWANHKNFFDGITWHGFNLSRVLESNWD